MLEFANGPVQREAVELMIANPEMLQKDVAALAGWDYRRLSQALVTVRRHAARKGYAPEHDWKHQCPPGYMMRGQSILYDADGNVKQQWVKTREDVLEQWLAMQEAVATLFQDIPKAEPRTIRTVPDSELLSMFPEGDPHWGMRVWGPESDGTDYDMRIALEEYQAAVDYLVESAPSTGVGISLNIGDNFHADNPESKTRRSGNHLNVDGRLQKVFSTVLNARRYKIDRMLEKCDQVIVREVFGNHDEVMCMGFTEALKGYYFNEPRVHIVTTPNAFWYYKFGKVLFGATHGDKTKIDDLPLLMATDCPQDWGDTTFRHFYTGHQHHHQRLEKRGVTVEMLRTLAARNEFEHSHGYRSGREMLHRLYHKEFGEVATSRIGIELLKHILDGEAEGENLG